MLKNDRVEENRIPSRETKTDKAGSALSPDDANPISDSDLDGVSGGAIYMKIDGIVKEDVPGAGNTILRQVPVAIDGIT